MDKGSGYISLYRSIQGHYLWEDIPFTKGQAWIDILLRASYDDRELLYNGKLYKLEAGEFITSMSKLSKAWGWSREKVRRYLDLLESDSMICYLTDTHKTAIKVLNYKGFQACSKIKQATNEQQTSNRRAANEQQTSTINKYNNCNNDNTYSLSCVKKYGEYQNVLLTDADLDKLKAEFPADYEERIERLSGYIESTGKKYKNHLATIRYWAKKDNQNLTQEKPLNATDDFMMQLQSMYE